METLTKIKDLVESLSVDLTKFYAKTNKSAGVRARNQHKKLNLYVKI